MTYDDVDIWADQNLIAGDAIHYAKQCKKRTAGLI